MADIRGARYDGSFRIALGGIAYPSKLGDSNTNFTNDLDSRRLSLKFPSLILSNPAIVASRTVIDGESSWA